MIVQPDFSPAQHFRVIHPLKDLSPQVVAEEPGVVRVYSQGGKQRLMGFHEVNDPRGGGEIFSNAAYGEDAGNTDNLRSLENLFQVRLKIRGIEMGMRIDEHYLRREPTSTGSMKVARTGVPPSDAATIIPFDSIPISFVGFRLATTTTRRPGRSSGGYSLAIPATT